MRKRLFIAIDIPQSNNIWLLLQKLKQLLAYDRISWVPLKNYHITIKFLGNTNENLIPEIVHKLEKISESFNQFSLSIKGLGTFPKSNYPKVIYFDIHEENGQLTQIANKINEKLKVFGFKSEKSIFKAHLTLARIKSIQNKQQLFDFVNHYKKEKLIDFQVKELILYESIISTKGATYNALVRFPLSK